jgi:hypothetical protein
VVVAVEQQQTLMAVVVLVLVVLELQQAFLLRRKITQLPLVRVVLVDQLAVIVERRVLIQYFQQLLQQAAVLAQVVLWQSLQAAQAVLVALQPMVEQVAQQVHQDKVTLAHHQALHLVHQVAVVAQARLDHR